VSGDAIATEEFVLLAGGQGKERSSRSDLPRRNPEAKAMVDRFRSEGFEPTGYTLLRYAAV
jgi:branched-chain amino acid transport system substrate-binding protein